MPDPQISNPQASKDTLQTAEGMYQEFLDKSGIFKRGPFDKTFRKLGEDVIPGLKESKYSSLILDAVGALLPGQTFRAWNILASQEKATSTLPVLAIRAGINFVPEGQEQKVEETLRGFNERIGSHPLIVTDFVASGRTIKRLISLLDKIQSREHITVAPVAGEEESFNSLRNECGNNVTILNGSESPKMRKLFDRKIFNRYQNVPDDRHSPEGQQIAFA